MLISFVASILIRCVDWFLLSLRTLDLILFSQFKRAEMFDTEYIRPQLRNGGLIEALRILKLGYPSRCTYKHVASRYGHLLPVGQEKRNSAMVVVDEKTLFQ